MRKKNLNEKLLQLQSKKGRRKVFKLIYAFSAIVLVINLSLVGVLFANISTSFATNKHSNTDNAWSEPDPNGWSTCAMVGVPTCGQTEGSQTQTVTCVASEGADEDCSLGTFVPTTYNYADPSFACPTNYHYHNDGSWSERCHRNNNNIHPEHKTPSVSCPSGYDQSGSHEDTQCKIIDVAEHYENPETKVLTQTCELSEPDNSNCEPACIDNDQDGYGAAGSTDCTYQGVDCNDTDPTINPGAAEVCGDDIDQDCSGEDLVCEETCTDIDTDGYGAEGSTSCELQGVDCNDDNADINPGATDICDGIDNNCSGTADEQYNVGEVCYVGIGACRTQGAYQCVATNDGTVCSATAGTGSEETCDEIDNDCDGETDEGGVCEAPTYPIQGYKWDDQDSDGNWDDGEPGLAGWQITLTGDANSTTTTSADTGTLGKYSFSGLVAGSYLVCEVNQTGWIQTYPDFDSNNPRCHQISLNSQSSDANYNFGNHYNGYCGDGIVQQNREESCDGTAGITTGYHCTSQCSLEQDVVPSTSSAPSTGGGGGGSSIIELVLHNESAMVATANTTETSITVSWLTNKLATSRVVYDTVSHSDLSTASAPNYGYAYSTVLDSEKVTNHSVTIAGLTAGVTYYFRPLSSASPEKYGKEVAILAGGDGKMELGQSMPPEPKKEVLGEKIVALDTLPNTGFNLNEFLLLISACLGLTLISRRRRYESISLK